MPADPVTAQSADPEPLPWAPGAATGVGSLPFDDPREAARLVLEELPDLPHVPELPGRGLGADMVGRAVALLADLHADHQPSGWRLVDRPGLDERRAGDFLARDLDAVEEAADGYVGPLKLQVIGPLTLVAGLELARGGAALIDHGAVRDIAEALAEGVAAHVADLGRRVPGARLLLQVDEPSLPAVLAGRVPTVSGFGTVRAVPESVAIERLGAVLAAGAAAGAMPLVHCCAADPPVTTAVRAGARAVSVDAAMLTGRAVIDAIGEAVEGGTSLLLGLVPARGPGVAPSVREAAAPVRSLWHRLGFAPELLGERVVVTPACGLAGASVGWALSAYRLCRQVGRALHEAPEGDRVR
ncbi:MAG: methionine synthase [Frankiaceae bacterium]